MCAKALINEAWRELTECPAAERVGLDAKRVNGVSLRDRQHGALPSSLSRREHAVRAAIFHRRRAGRGEREGKEEREGGRGRGEGLLLNFCQMFGGRLLLGSADPEAEWCTLSCNEGQE